MATGTRPGASRSGEATRRHILDVAERICAQHGMEGLSIRAVSEQAGVNIAAIGYHFGGKQQLFEEMFRRRVTPLNEERLRLLDEALRAPRQGMLGEVLRSFVEPVIRGTSEDSPYGDSESGTGNPGRIVMQFLSRAFVSSSEEKFLEAHYEPVRSRFMLALQVCLPDLPLADLLWRYNMMVGSLIYAMGGAQRMTRLPLAFGHHPAAGQESSEASIERMVAFLKAGFAAPAVRNLGPQRTR